MNMPASPARDALAKLIRPGSEQPSESGWYVVWDGVYGVPRCVWRSKQDSEWRYAAQRLEVEYFIGPLPERK